MDPDPTRLRPDRPSPVPGWMARLPPMEPPAESGRRLLDALAGAERRHERLRIVRRRWSLSLATAAGLLVSVGVLGLSHAASEVRGASASGSDAAVAAVVDDPTVPLFHGLESFDALGEPGGAEGAR